MDNKIVAAFDFDGTLTRKDTFVQFAMHSVGLRRFLAACALCSLRLVLWKLHLCKGGDVKERIFRRLYKGMPVNRFREFCASFVPLIESATNEDIVERLNWHIHCGHTVCIVSASVPEWIVPWAEKHGVLRENVIGTDIGIDDEGCLTGNFVSLNCTGEEKVKRLREVVDGLDKAILYAYGNSSGDRPLLNISDYPTYIG